MNWRIIGALASKDFTLFFRNRFIGIVTILGLVFYILFYFLMPRTVDELAGGAGILRRAQCEVSELLQRIENHEPEACRIICEAGTYFGYTLTNIAHLFNPDIIVVGGSTATYAGYMGAALAAVEKYTLKVIFESCQIVEAQDNQRIVALGAIEFAKQK